MVSKSSTVKAIDTTEWTFLTNHAHVLVCIAQEPEMRIRDIASRVGITERAVQRIIAVLEEESYIQKIRNGRRNLYRVQRNLPLRHPIEQHRDVSELLGLFLSDGPNQ
ncbi:MAG: winged helix-turn-helix transcriptional regulator [Deltaproteobacteria bacterium]|nr:winged helix-turn-helix transcriptional regulator [Deltaproteobacteria bacterium]